MYGWTNEKTKVTQHDLEALMYALALQDECGWDFVDWNLPA